MAVKVAADQVLWAPIFTAMYFSYLGLAEGRSLDYIQAKIQNDTMAGVTASWKVWPIVHAVSFRFVPTELRILYINSIQVRWRGVFRGGWGERDEGGGAAWESLAYLVGWRCGDGVRWGGWGTVGPLGLVGMRRSVGVCRQATDMSTGPLPFVDPLVVARCWDCSLFGMAWSPVHPPFPVLDLLQHLPVGAWQQERVGRGFALPTPRTSRLVAHVRQPAGLDRCYFPALLSITPCHVQHSPAQGIVNSCFSLPTLSPFPHTLPCWGVVSHRTPHSGPRYQHGMPEWADPRPSPRRLPYSPPRAAHRHAWCPNGAAHRPKRPASGAMARIAADT